VALINIGAAISNINIITDGASIFTRDVTVGGGAFTEEIQKRAHVSHEEAEGFKIALSSGVTDGVPPGVEAIMTEIGESMAGKLQRTLDFFLAASSDATLSRMYLCGGSAKVPALKRILAERSRVPVEIIDPFRRLAIDEGKFDMDFIRAHAAEATVGLGLALRRQGDRS
jgi:type IV pilus assembly protein PilM